MFNLTEMRLTNVIKLPEVVGSVKWPEFNQSRLWPCAFVELWSSPCVADVCVSCTTDNGRYYVFDVRQQFEKPAFEASLGKQVPPPPPWHQISGACAF